MDQEIHMVTASPTTAKPAAANDPMVLLAAPVKGAEPVPFGATGVIGEPVAEGPDPAPEPVTMPDPDPEPEEPEEPDEPVPVGNGAPVPVANPVGPAIPEELQQKVSIDRNWRY